MKQYYVTTPIFYVNAKPHLGHLHSMVLADTAARWNALKTGRPSLVSTGTDEHGLKVQRAAEAAGLSPKDLCDRVSGTFRELANRAGLNASFIRTTEKRHADVASTIWSELQKRDLIYTSTYKGWYSVSDEAYYTDSEITRDDNGNVVSSVSGSSVEWMEESNYHFRLSQFEPALKNWVQSCNVVIPEQRKLQVLDNLHEAPLRDLSISRPKSRLSWGIPVPNDPSQVMYVWFEALINYLTNAGYHQDPHSSWPPDMCVIGKDISRFHVWYLPGILLALDLPLPRKILVHGHWMVDGLKMSKSRGNVCDPNDLFDIYGNEPVRSILLERGGNSARDAKFDAQSMQAHYDMLRGQLGNLVSRVLGKKLLAKLDSIHDLWTEPNVSLESVPIREDILAFPSEYAHALDLAEYDRAMRSLFLHLAKANQHLQQCAPWSKDTSPLRAHTALFYTSEALRQVAIALIPVMPHKSNLLLDSLGVLSDHRSWAHVHLGEGGPRQPQKAPLLFPAIESAEAHPAHF